MRRFLVIFLLGLSVNAQGQYFPSEHWHKGYLVTVQNDTLKGLLKYDLDNDLVQIEHNSKMATFSSRKMTFFEIQDEVTESYRKFYAIPYNVNLDYKVPRIFEMLYLGELTLLAREIIVQEAISPSSTQIYGTRRRLSHKFYFVDSNSKITAFNNKRNELLELMADKEPEIRNYVKKHKLRMDRLTDLVRVTAFYNSI